MTQDRIIDNQITAPRGLDPNVVQRRASNPEASVWVSASAGTGKTKVLTDRVLRLLLPREDGAPGTKPSKILGITFTKAAASEMSLRITERLGSWAIIPLEDLQKDLEKLLNKKPTGLDINAARKLFADVVDTPGGLKIMTIHAFCQSVLGRFPLEANLPPYFSVLEERQAQELLKQAQENTIRAAQENKASELHQSFEHIARTINETQFFSLLQDVMSERRQFTEVLEKHFDINGLYTALCKKLDVQPGQNEQELLQNFCDEQNFDLEGLKQALDALNESTKKTDLEKAQKMGTWLNTGKTERIKIIDAYISAFLTAKGTPRKTQATKEAQNKKHDILDVLEKETLRLITISEQIKALNCTSLTRDILRLGQRAFEEYEALKQKTAALDFDDLILKTRTLLTNDQFKSTNASWVLYKMDQGIEHILVDEAQDTNPDQWSIIEALCKEFFSGKGSNEGTRTVFVVGDEKQSIYSFQRASPEEFSRMRADFEKKVLDAKERWEPVDLDISFRSTKSVLSAVDSAFSDPALRKGLSLKDIQHHAYRSGEEGSVELWPIFESTDKTDIDLWEPPTEIISNPSGQIQLAEHIASTIDQWLTNEEMLASKGRPIKPGDIMILVRSRNALVTGISRALKARDIPISGSDRMVLNDQLVIEDLLATAACTLLPSDDLTLACVLKSPLINLSEEELFELAHKRTGSLWNALQNSEHSEIKNYLSHLIDLATHAGPFQFLNIILQTPCPTDEQSGIRAIQTRLGAETLDPINELLRSALEFEQNHIPSLQGFTSWQAGKQDQIKRELSESENQIRIMTVHGAKGLQAPIVIMPDTMRTTTSPPGQIDKRLIWPDKSELSLPIWSPRKDKDPQIFTEQMEKLDERLDEEYRRLLYVAMTRAEDRLYIGGYAGQKKPLENSWYYHIKAGLERLAELEKTDDIIKIENPQTKEIKQKKEIKKPTSQFEKVPDFLYENAPQEPHPPTPLVPSRPSEIEIAATSPLKSQNNYRFRRGNITHKLLETLPDLPENTHIEAAQGFLKRFANDLPESTKQNIIDETLNILGHPEFSKIFTPNSRAEVPISGHLPDGRLISGQIDRLLITDSEILIIDYKTNRPPPQKAEDVPDIYQKQMQAYADTLRTIYPDRSVKAALLWTDGPSLMPVQIK